MKKTMSFYLILPIIVALLTFTGCARNTEGVVFDTPDTTNEVTVVDTPDTTNVGIVDNTPDTTNVGIVDNTPDTKTMFEINNEKIELEDISILSDKVNLLIPNSFTIMSEKMANIKYPAEGRPTLIYTNESCSVNVAFNYTESQATQSQIPEYLDYYKKIFENVYPAAQWYNSGLEEINGKNIGVMELLTPAIDTEIYVLIWFTDLDGKLLLSSFNCTKEQKNDWEPIAKVIMDSQQYN